MKNNGHGQDGEIVELVTRISVLASKKRLVSRVDTNETYIKRRVFMG